MTDGVIRERKSWHSRITFITGLSGILFLSQEPAPQQRYRRNLSICRTTMATNVGALPKRKIQVVIIACA